MTALARPAPVVTPPAARRGEHTQYVLVEPGGQWTLRHSHWGASAILTDLAAGPDFALRRLVTRPLAPDWFGDGDCEAGLLIDSGRRVLMFFGAHRQVMHL
ncbi:MAG: hypothetical protein QOI35_2668, partial [Cryptosporangiaceae bacterium]|nr:hypothetical protein [Cryptosporangiaceae bacterium]